MIGERRSPYLNWGVVTDPAAARALEALLTPGRMSERWTGLSTEARDLHRQILSEFLSGGPPSAAGTISGSGALMELRNRDLVFVDRGRVGAYPFAPHDSGHRVTTGGASFWAVCVIDAFGIAATLGAPGRIETDCPHCAGNITFEVCGDEVKGTAPSGAQVWAAEQETQGCAASSQCRTMRAFCSEEHLSSWVGAAQGFRLSAEQAAQLGAAIFGPGSAFHASLAAA